MPRLYQPVAVSRSADPPASLAPLGETSGGEFAENPQDIDGREPCPGRDRRGAQTTPDGKRVQDGSRFQVELIAGQYRLRTHCRRFARPAAALVTVLPRPRLRLPYPLSERGHHL